MQQQEIADRLHAAFLKGTVMGKPWLAVAAEAEAINNPVTKIPEDYRAPVPDKLQYRMLEVGEIIAGGDECFSTARNYWFKVKFCMGGPVLESAYGELRRPIPSTDESPSDCNTATNNLCDELHTLRKVIDEKNLEIFKLHTQCFDFNNKVENLYKTLDAALKSRDLWEAGHDSLQRKADAHDADLRSVIGRQKEKLENAATYIEGLERDLSFHVDATNAAIMDADFYRNNLEQLQAWQNAVKNVVAL